jgi:phenylacetate-CoA ligase
LGFALDFLYNTEEKSTIIFNTFALGTWVAGVKISKMLLEIANKKSSNITVVNVGVNNKECLEMLTDLSPYYEQVLIMGYNPVVKELLEMAQKQKFPFETTKINLMIGGEGFSEEWREYVSNLLHFNIDDYDQKIVSGYAAADTGMDMGFEYPICTFVRRLLTKYPELNNQIFGKNIKEAPLFFQYTPNRIYIEEKDGELVFTSNSSIPLIRYNLHDRGGVIGFNELCRILSKYPEFEDFKSKHEILPLPFVYLWGKSDGTVTLLGAKIYLENIKSAVFQKSLRCYLTGNFHAYSDYDNDMKQQFNLTLETNSKELAEENIELIKKRIVKALQKSSSEYLNAYNGNPEVATPIIQFTDSEEFKQKFNNGIKIIYN